MNTREPQIRMVGDRRIAFRRLPATRPDLAGVVWLGGFMSDMTSSKAAALEAFCAREGRGSLRFDYSGHGLSSGEFSEGTVSRWLEEAREMILRESEGPQVIVGSSMGGYLALLVARELHRLGETSRLKGFVLVAPAIDFTQTLLWAKIPEAGRRAIEAEGIYRIPSPYGPKPYTYTRDLIEDGRTHLIFDTEIRSFAPVRILQGMLDPDVPYAHALRLVEHMPRDNVTLTLVKDGDHRLSREPDIALLVEAVKRMAEGEA